MNVSTEILMIWGGLGLAFFGLLVKAFAIPSGPDSSLFRLGNRVHNAGAAVVVGAALLAVLTNR